MLVSGRVTQKLDRAPLLPRRSQIEESWKELWSQQATLLASRGTSISLPLAWWNVAGCPTTPTKKKTKAIPVRDGNSIIFGYMNESLDLVLLQNRMFYPTQRRLSNPSSRISSFIIHVNWQAKSHFQSPCHHVILNHIQRTDENYDRL